jgi:hypothetical protein
LSQLVNAAAMRSARLVGRASLAREVALAAAGMPSTICRLRWPPGNADTLKALKSVICAGAAHVVCGGDVGWGDGDGITVIISVTVVGGTERVTVTGASVTIYVAVITSVIVSLRTGGKGAAIPTGEDDASTEDIEVGVIMGGSMEKRIPSIVVIAGSAVPNVSGRLKFALGVEFPAGISSGPAGAAKAAETASVEANNIEFKSIRAEVDRRTL